MLPIASRQAVAARSCRAGRDSRMVSVAQKLIASRNDIPACTPRRAALGVIATARSPASSASATGSLAKSG